MTPTRLECTEHISLACLFTHALLPHGDCDDVDAAVSRTWRRLGRQLVNGHEL